MVTPITVNNRNGQPIQVTPRQFEVLGEKNGWTKPDEKKPAAAKGK